MEDKRFAVLIDADNVSAKYIKHIMDEIATYGVATYKRIYGDWTKPNAANWKEVLLENSVTPVQQYNYTTGKNATDSAMIIDAMDILYSGFVDGYSIVSSDSDFTKLASRLRESGMTVIGMGERKTPKPFIAACNQFKYLDVLAESEKKTISMEATASTKLQKDHGMAVIMEGNAPYQTKMPSTDEAKSMTELHVIKQAVVRMLVESDDGQCLTMAEIGNRLAKRYPDFDVRNYGDTKLSKFLKKFGFLDIRAGEGTAMLVSMKPEVGEKKDTAMPDDKAKVAAKKKAPRKKAASARKKTEKPKQTKRTQ